MVKAALPGCLRRVVLALLEDLDTPRSLTVKLLIEHGELDQLVRLKVDPQRYATADLYFRDAIATDLLRKCVDLETGIDRKGEAFKAFEAAEKQCYVTNARLEPYLHNGPFNGPTEVRVADFLQRVKQFIAGVLGSLPRDIAARHGPGATIRDRGHRSTVPDKMSSRPTSTFEARCLLPLWSMTAWARALCQTYPDRSDPEIMPGNRFTSVPKDATRDRGIAIEPSLNVFFQLGVGDSIRSRLRSVGIDLEEGQALHRQVACDASRTGALATIDLSSASDTVCRNLVKLLLPDAWYELLSSLRSPFTDVEGRQYHLQKFSSMGNGYTFELETLIFLGIAIESCRAQGVTPLIGENVLVYGDDIIVPSECAEGLLSALRFCGFTPNASKTFTTGWFRESCGGDFLRGAPVRAHFLEEFPHEPQDWMSLANGLRRLFFEFYGTVETGLGLFQRAWFRVLDNIPSNIRRLRGPSQLGDLVIHDSQERWSCRIRKSIRWFRVWRPVTKSIPLTKWRPLIQLAAALYGVPSAGPIPRDAVSGYRFGRVPLS